MNYETTNNTDDTDENESSAVIRVNPCPSVVPLFSWSSWLLCLWFRPQAGRCSIRGESVCPFGLIRVIRFIRGFFFLVQILVFLLFSLNTNDAHGWRGNTTDQARWGLGLRTVYPWVCHAICGSILFCPEYVAPRLLKNLRGTQRNELLVYCG